MGELRKFMVFTIDTNCHEYDITVIENEKGTTYSLFASNNAIWNEHIRGTLLQTVIDTGDDVEFSVALLKLDYGALEEIQILLAFRKAMDKHAMLSYKIIEDTNTITI